METHYKINLATYTIVERAGVPSDLVGLTADVLANPSAHINPCPPQHSGFGYWPMLFEVLPYEPATQRLSDQLDEAPDPVTMTVIVRPIVVNLTTAEHEARLATLRLQRKAAATALRWEKETAGIVIAGVQVATDDRSKMLILGKRAQAQSNPATVFRWKAASGEWVDLTGAQIIAIADAVGDHVQACFDREGALHDAIDAAPDAVAVMAVDISAGWP